MEHTDQDLNRLAHEALGKGCWHEPNRGNIWTCGVCGESAIGVTNYGGWPSVVPNYTESLDAVRPLEELAVEKSKDAYWDALEDEFDWPRDGGINEVDELVMVLAPARTRCIAALKALGKI